MHFRSLSVASHKPCEVCSELVESVVDFGVIIGSDIYALAVLQLLTAGEITFHPCKFTYIHIFGAAYCITCKPLEGPSNDDAQPSRILKGHRGYSRDINTLVEVSA